MRERCLLYPQKADIVCDKVWTMKPITAVSVRANSIHFPNGGQDVRWASSSSRPALMRTWWTPFG